MEAIGRHRRAGAGYRLLFHDTHHRSVTDRSSMAAYRLESYDGVLAFGEVIRQRYIDEGWARQVWTWHQAADGRLFHPGPRNHVLGDLIWVGNWGDEEHAAGLEEFLIRQVERLRLRARIYGVRYPAEGIKRLARAGIEYAGWLPNSEVPAALREFCLTLHIPRRPYMEMLLGIPTIRVFEVLACGIPLICSPWSDAEQLFTPGRDFLIARTGAEMRDQIAWLLADGQAARKLASHGWETILARHTCGHRVDELMDILSELKGTDQGHPAN